MNYSLIQELEIAVSSGQKIICHTDGQKHKSSYGTVVVSKEVTSEIQEIDVYFSPNTEAIPPQLGLLGKLCQNPCLLEPYRNGITLDGINDCLSKRFAIREIFHREAKRNKQRISEEEIPKLSSSCASESNCLTFIAPGPKAGIAPALANSRRLISLLVPLNSPSKVLKYIRNI